MPDDKIALPAPRGSMPMKIGRYRIIDRIGRGAMGVVYSAQDEVIGRQVALKVLMADLESDPDTRTRFAREAQAAARLLHPNIITIFDAGEDQGRSFIAMQLLEGAPLAAYLKRPEAAVLERKLDLMIQMCEGLAAAHGQGIVHRDLKPSNLFVQSDGLLKILDFGVARFVDSSMTAAGTMLGTPDYMSPEQARGAPIDARSDIFSTGAVFYFILTGRKPFAGPDLPTVLRQLQFEQPAPLGETVPPELEALVLRTLAKNADDRPARTEDVLATLVRFRRQAQSETRRLVMAARASFEEARGLIAALGDASIALGLDEENAAASALQSIQTRFPALFNRASASEASGFERGRVMAILDDLAVQRDELTHALETRRSYLSQLETGEQSLAAGDARAALACFDAVAAACPHSTRARELATSTRPLAREQAAREERAIVRTTAARRAMDARDWTTAVAECRQAVALAPHHEPALSLLAEAEQAIAHEQRRIAHLAQRLLDRAAQAIEQHEFEIADATLKEAETVAPGSPVVADLRRQLAAERAAAEATELLRQLSLEEVRRARSVFRRGRYDEAVEQLRGFLEVEPAAGEVEQELDQLIALRESLVFTAATARRKSADCLARATVMVQSGDVSGALELAREALREDPTDGEAAAMVDRLSTRRLEERIAQEKAQALDDRERDAAPLLDAARFAQDRGYVAIALRAALAAQRLLPQRTDVAALVEEARHEFSTEDREIFDLPSLTDAPPVEPDAAPAPESGSMRRWAAGLLRTGLRRGRS